MEKVKLKTVKLRKKIIKIFRKFGLNNSHASISADAIINAELVGAYGHGLSRLKMYCDRISKKVINPKPKIKIKKISQSISHIDADNSIGFVAADLAIKKAIQNADPQEIILIAGKGHEEQQVYKNKIINITDRKIVKKINIKSKILNKKKR